MRIHSLSTRFVLTLLLSTVLPFLAFGWWARVEMEDRLKSQFVDVLLPDQAASAAASIEAELKLVEQACGMLQNELGEILRSGREPRNFDQDVDFMSYFDPDLILLAGSDGDVLCHHLTSRQDPETKAVRESLVPASVAQEAWFHAVTKGQQGGTLWRDRHLSKFRHRTPNKVTRDPKDYSFALAMQVPTTQRKPAALYALMSWSKMQAVLDETAEFLREEAGFDSAEVFLCNKEGEYLAHTVRANYAHGRLPAELQDSLPAPGEPVERPFVSDDDEDRRAGLAAVHPYAGLEWWVGLHARSDELLATSRELGDVLVVVTAIIVLILVAWSMVASRAILRPVRRLADATETVARGDLSVRVPAGGRHEIADLGRAFNKMAEDLDHHGQQLRRAERQAAWAEMARQVAHEIKNPLTPMRMSAQLLLKAKRDQDDRLPELTDRLARTVLEQTDALSRIASEFRNFAGPPSRRLEVLEADRLLEDVQGFFSAVAEEGQVELVFELGANGDRIEVDREELNRVFLNLIQNAFAACGEDGRVEVSSERVGDSMVFRVVDNGTGVNEEVRGKLFDPYFTTKSSGTGLGLAICRRILEAHGGGISLESSVPGRTVFRIELPIAKDS